MDISSFLVGNVQLLALIVLGYVLLAAATTILPKLTHANRITRLKSLKLILFRVPFADQSKLPRVHLRLMLLFFSLFLFVNLNLLAGTIKTDKVTVDTDAIVHSASKLLSTPKTLVLHVLELNSMRLAPEGSFLKRLFTSKKQLLVVDSFNDLIRMKANGINNHVIFMDSNFVAFFVDFLSRYANGVAFFKSTAYYEFLTVYPIRRSLD